MTLPGFDGLDSLPVLRAPRPRRSPGRIALETWPRAERGRRGRDRPRPGRHRGADRGLRPARSRRAPTACVVAGSRGGEERIAACVVAADTRADVNTTVRKLLDVRKASFLSMDRAVEDSGMEYGGITPIGLPASWRLLVDAALLPVPAAMIGSGVRRSKIILPGSALGDLPGAEVVEGLGNRSPDGRVPERSAHSATVRHTTLLICHSRGREALHPADVRRQPARGGRPGGRAGAGGARHRLGAGGLRLRRPDADGLPGGQDRAGRDRLGDPQHLLPHAERAPPDGRRPRQRLAGPRDPRPRRQRSAGHRGLPRGAVRQAARPHPRDRRPGPPRPAPRDPANDGLYPLPLPEGQGTGLGKPLKLLTKPERPAVPIYVAALGQKNVEATAEYADGWLPFLFHPEKAHHVWGDCAGRRDRQAAGGARAPRDLRRRHGRHRRGPRDQGAARLRATVLRPVRRRHGRARQELLQRPRLPVRLRARRPRRSRTSTSAATSATPRPRSPLEWLEATNLVGPASYVQERIAAYAEAGVTNLQVLPVSDDPAATVRTLKEWVS